MPNRGPPTSLTIVTVVSGKSEINSSMARKLMGSNKNIENANVKYEVIVLMKKIKNYENVIIYQLLVFVLKFFDCKKDIIESFTDIGRFDGILGNYITRKFP